MLNGIEVKEVLNSKGSPIVLNAREVKLANYLQQMCNALGYEIPITTLTAISKSVVEQKFFQIRPSDYVPVRVGEGAWSSEIITYRSFITGGAFEDGVVDTGGSNSRLAQTDAGLDAVSVQVKNWAKEIVWSIMDLQMAARSGNWDLVTAKERSRKENWDLGVQRTAFLGLAGNANVKGLLTQADVNSNTSLITKYISAMNDTEFEAFARGIVGAYRSNAAYTAMPTHFIIPELDYDGLAVAVDENFGLVSKIERLEKIFKTVTQNPNFAIKPLAYADQANNADVSGLNKNRYTLMRYDSDSVRMDIPVDYTNTMQNTINGFNFSNVGYGQFTGVKAYRPLEMLYLDFAV